ncbi:pilus assembly FimT family protein [Sorangium sp. So ce131]|uniref:pilus assembly FimT family protein n=1 Tax=Sorangium sp. So ce131 TaxID=3133282 RepID=UPI003F63FB08
MMEFHRLARALQGMRLAFAGHSVRSFSCSRPPPRAPGRRPACAPRARARRRGAARGFTLPELLAVIILIGVLAAVASPSFINAMRDRRVNRAAMEISGVYRLARYRALGRGTAVLVRWTDATGVFEVREALVQDVGGSLIANSCANVDWTSPATTAQVTRLNTAGVELAEVELRDPSGADGTVQPQADVCFTARGRTFVRYNTGAAFVPLVGALRVNVTNTNTTLLRRVFIPPNGVARLAL